MNAFNQCKTAWAIFISTVYYVFFLKKKIRHRRISFNFIAYELLIPCDWSYLQYWTVLRQKAIRKV